VIVSECEETPKRRRNLLLLGSSFLLNGVGFEIPQTEMEFLRKRVMEEKANAEKANSARLEAERRCLMAEKERDVYRLLARRWKARLQADSGDSDNETIEEAAAAILLGGRDSTSMFSIGNMFRRFRSRSSTFSRRETEEEDSDAGSHDRAVFEASDRMEEDDNEVEEMSEDSENEEEDSSSDEEEESLLVASGRAVGKASKTQRSQARTVSLSEDDF
jgi:hypothetical protein